MDYTFYLKQFEEAVKKVNKSDFDKAGIQIAVVIILNSVAVKAYKPEWSGDFKNPLYAESRIFFSVWISEKSINEQKLYYNIHALKLRQLKEYKITSRDFAANFRLLFKKQQNNWINCSTQYGPLTLMEGWQALSIDTLQKDIAVLLRKFLAISDLIDETLDLCRIK